jgi:hypothetical protein
MTPCAICDGFEQKLQHAYEELAEKKADSRRDGEKAQRKLSRLLSAKLAHQAKQGCLRQVKQKLE